MVAAGRDFGRVMLQKPWGSMRRDCGDTERFAWPLRALPRVVGARHCNMRLRRRR